MKRMLIVLYTNKFTRSTKVERHTMYTLFTNVNIKQERVSNNTSGSVTILVYYMKLKSDICLTCQVSWTLSNVQMTLRQSVGLHDLLRVLQEESRYPPHTVFTPSSSFVLRDLYELSSPCDLCELNKCGHLLTENTLRNKIGEITP